jgi:glucokinase
MTILLAGDIGGTKTILRLVASEATDSQPLPTLKTLYEATYSSREFPDLVPMVRRFREATTAEIGEAPLPEGACFGIAGPVVNHVSKLTNLSWSLEADRLAQELAIAQVSLINDFAAIGYGVLGLTAADLHTLQPGKLDLTAPIAVIGAGTGLGEGFLVPGAKGYRVFPSEGGHVDFAPRSELEFQMTRYLQEKFNTDRVSVERVVSGMGIVGIYQFLRDRHISNESPEVYEIYKKWQHEIGQDEKTIDLAAVISQYAQAQGDYLCQETMKLFVKAYGAEAGNLALKLLPYGGLYIAGGIAAKNLSLIERGGFLQAFLQKGRVSPLLEDVPVHVILNPRVGLIGAALYAANLFTS